MYLEKQLVHDDMLTLNSCEPFLISGKQLLVQAMYFQYNTPVQLSQNETINFFFYLEKQDSLTQRYIILINQWSWL